MLNQKCVRDHTVNFDLGRRHDSEAKKVSPERYVRAGDVLVNSTGTGTLGRVAQLREGPPEPTTVDSHVTIVRPKDGLFYPEFFGYALVSIEEQIQEGGEGCGGQTELSRSKLASGYRIGFPTDRNEQRRIVAILDEAFEAVGAATANTERSLQLARELFDSRLETIFSTSAGGWVQKRLQDVCAKITDGTHQTPKYFEQGVIFLSSRNVTSGKIDWENIKYIDLKQHAEMHKRVAPRIDDILLAKNGTTGVAAIVDRDVTFDIYVSLALIRSLGAVLPRFLLHFINSPVAKRQFNKRLKGVGVPNLHLEEIREVLINFPVSLDEQAQVLADLDELRNQVENLRDISDRKLAALAELKKSLLHQAFAGQLTAKTTDKQLAEVA